MLCRRSFQQIRLTHSVIICARDVSSRAAGLSVYMQISPLVASLIGAFSSAGILEVLESIPWRSLFGVASSTTAGGGSEAQCATASQLLDAFAELDERFCPERGLCQEVLEVFRECFLDAGTHGVVVTSFIAFTFLTFFAGWWSAQRSWVRAARSGREHPALALGRPSARARAAGVLAPVPVPDLARRSHAR